jgi:transcriptional regulator NrdR family protein
MLLQKCDGPSCPRCGCQDAEILASPGASKWFPSGRAVCRNCQSKFTFKEVAADKPVESDVDLAD